MMEAMMEDPLSPQPQLTRVVHDIKDCIVQLKKESSESQSPITDDSQALHKLCAKLEYLLQAGLKVRSTLLGGKKDYFNYFSDCLSASKATDDGLKFIKNLPEVKTQLGKGRAFIRFGLVHQRLADTLQQCVINQRVTSEWYHPMAVWQQPQIYSELIGSLYDLNDTKFDLSPRGYDLDTAWPTFARKNFNAQNPWTPHSRTSSVSSLASAVESPSGGNDLYSSIRNVSDLEHLRNDLARSESLRTKLEEENEGLQNKAVLLEGQLLSLQDQCKELQAGNEQSKKELNLTEQAWLEQEADYQAQIRTLKDSQSKSSTESATSGLETKMKKQASDQQTAALRMEIAGLQKDLSSKDTVSQAKDKLIDALEAKLTSTKTTNSDLISKLEMMIKEKNKNSEKWIESAKELETLTARVVTAERENMQLRRDVAAGKRSAATTADNVVAEKVQMREESSATLEEALKTNESLKRVNSELREMLAVLEEKCQKISTLAKDKVKSLSEENKRLKVEMTALQGQGDTGDQSGLPNGLSSVAMSTSVREEELCESLNASEALNQEIKREIEALRQELETRESTFDMEKGEITEHMESLQKQMAQQKDQLEDATSRITQLEAEKSSLIEDIARKEDEKARLEQSLTEKLEATQSEMTVVQEELLTLKSASQQANEAQKTLEEQPDKDFVDGLHSQIVELKQEVDSLNNNHSTAQTQIDNLKMQLSQSEAVNSDLKTRLDQSEVTDVRQVQSETLLGKADEQPDIETMNETMQTMKALTERNVELESNDRTFKMRIEELMNAMSTLESDNSALKEELQVLEGETSRILDEKLSRLQEKLANEKKARSTLESDMSKLKVAHQDNETRLKTVEEEKKRSMKRGPKQQIKALQGQVDKLSKEKVESEKQIKSLQSQLDTLIKEKEEIEKQLQESVSHFENELKNKEGDLQKLPDDICEQSDSVKLQVNELESQLAAKDTLISDLQEKVDEQEALKVKISELLRENDSLHDVYQSTQLELSSARAELEEEKAQAGLVFIDSDRTKKENERLQEEMRTIASDLARTSSEVESLKLENDYISSKYKDLHSKLVESEAEMIASEELEMKKKEFEASLETLKEENRKLKDEVDNLNMDLNNKICDSVTMETEMRSCREDWEEQRQVYEQEVSSLKFQLSSEQLKQTETEGASLASVSDVLSQQEALVQSLETQLQEMKAEHERDMDKQQTQLSEVKQLLSIREEDNSMLHDNLKRTSLLLDEERNTVLKFKNELAQNKEVSLQKDKEMEDLRNDSAALRNQLVKLIKDKDSLWQKNDQLEHVQKLTAASKWMDNHEATRCLHCQAEFSMLLRRHHCRMCGRIFCNSCCGNKIMTPHSSKKERVCDNCFLVTSSTPESSVPVEEQEKKASINVPSAQAALGTGSPTRSPAQVASSAEEVSVLTKEDAGKDEQLSHSRESLDAGCQGDTDVDEHFDVITEEEIKEVNKPSPPADVEPGQMPVDVKRPLSVEDIEQGVSAASTDLWVKAGESHEIPILISTPGIVLIWQFSTDPKGISFSVNYYPDKNCAEADVLIPLCKCNSHKQAVQGELMARKPGLYTMLFDNTASRFTAKHLECKLQIQRPEAAN